MPQEGAAEPGKYRTTRAPYQRDMLNDPLDPTCDEFIWVIASQIGKTACFIIIIQYFMDQVPSAILVVYPTIDSAKAWASEKFTPQVEATPRIRGLLKDPRKRDAKNTQLNKKFPGGNITVTGANSPSGLRQRSKKVVMQDELDAFQDNAEGDPVEQADKRAETFHDAVKGKATTPTISGISRSEPLFEASDKQRFFVPCWKCGHMQWLKWKQLKWPDGPKEAFYECESEPCRAHWTDQQRIAAICDPRAEWRATNPASLVRGRHLSGLYQLIGKKKAFKNFLHQFASNHLKAVGKGRAALMVWTNTFLAEWWQEDIAQRIPAHELAKRAEDYTPETLPAGVVVVTAGIDLQSDRAEITFEGWGDGYENWKIQHIVLPGDPTSDGLYQQIDAQLLRKFKRADGQELAVTTACFDSAWKSDYVYDFCRTRFARRIYATKGSNIAAQPIASALLRTGRRQNPYFRLGTDTAKATIYGRLKQMEGPGAIHFPKDPTEKLGFTDNYYTGLVCEELRRKWHKGKETFAWYKPDGARNEPLDCAVQNLAAVTILNPAFDVLGRSLAPKVKDYTLRSEAPTIEEPKQDEPTPTSKPAQPARRPMKPRQNFVNGWRKW